MLQLQKSSGFDWMLFLMKMCIKRSADMRATVTIDDALYKQALELADADVEMADIFREALKTFVRVQVAKRLSALGGSTPHIQEVPRRDADFLSQ
jgi:hypothetical protein